MGWAPRDFVGFEGGFFPGPRLPVLLAHGQQNAIDVCDGLNYRLSTHTLSPRFGWLPASDFTRHEQLNIEASIREAQRGDLPGDNAGNIHWVAKQATTLGESLSQTGEPYYVFFRFFPKVHGPLPLGRIAVLPDEEIGAAIEAETQQWAAKNKKLITERLRKLKEQSAQRVGGHSHRESRMDKFDVAYTLVVEGLLKTLASAGKNGSAAPTPVAAKMVQSGGKRRAVQHTGGRPRKWDTLWTIIKEKDAEKPKPKDQAIANAYNQKYARSINDGKLKRATKVIVARVRYERTNRCNKQNPK